MLNRTALVFVSLAAILGFALGGSVVWNLQFGYTAIQTIDTTQQHHSANAKAVQEWEKPEDALARYTWWLTAFTGVLAIATIGLGAATIWLCLAGERQFKLARDEFRSTHRPKIRVKHSYLVSDIWQDEPIIVNITFVNPGTAEAIPAEIGLRYFVVRKDRALPIEPSIPGIGAGVGQKLVVGKNWTIENVNANKTLTPQENADIQQGRSSLYAVGYVSYLDAAGQMRITGFCRVLTFPPDQVAFRINSRFRRFRDPDYEYDD
jgi:hypothetical protein